MSPFEALMLENLYDSVTSPWISFESVRIDAPPPMVSPSLACIELPLLTLVKLSPPNSAPALNTGLTSTAFDVAGTVAAITKARVVKDLSTILPVILCSPLDRAAGTRTRSGQSIAYALCAPEEEAQAHEDPSAGGVYSFAVVVRRAAMKVHVFHPHPEPVRAQQHAEDAL